MILLAVVVNVQFSKRAISNLRWIASRGDTFIKVRKPFTEESLGPHFGGFAGGFSVLLAIEVGRGIPEIRYAGARRDQSAAAFAALLHGPKANTKVNFMSNGALDSVPYK